MEAENASPLGAPLHSPWTRRTGREEAPPRRAPSSPDGAGPAADPPVFSTVLVYATSARVYVVAGTSDKSRWRILNVSRALNADDSLEASEDPLASTTRRIVRSRPRNDRRGKRQRWGHDPRRARTRARGHPPHFRCALLVVDHRTQTPGPRARPRRVRRGGHGARAHRREGHAPTDGPPPVFSTSSSKAASRAAESRAPASGEEKRLKKLLAWVDLSRGCFYSHTYGLTATLQSNILDADAASRAPRDFDSPFAWNAHVSLPLRYAALGGAAAARWLVPLVHGFFERRRVSLLGRRLEITLIARRSRHFAGTRYRRRGVNARGRVANEVETEQIVDASAVARSASATRSSFVGRRRVYRVRVRLLRSLSRAPCRCAGPSRCSGRKKPPWWRRDRTIVLDAPSCSSAESSRARGRTDATATTLRPVRGAVRRADRGRAQPDQGRTSAGGAKGRCATRSSRRWRR